MREGLKRFLLGIAIAAVLAVVFVAYLRPSFIFDLANRIILCF
ncbi:MAG TPA: hypothetical protein VEC35_13770 [Noviherbaspirillum sp.]|nr:hypothetical protein [Noviherbaspirillum sp.]